MRILLAGKFELAEAILHDLLRVPALDVGVVTCKTEPEQIARPTLKHAAAARGLRPLNRDYSHAALLEAVRCFRADLLVSAGFDKIIRPEVFSAVPLAVNVHFGLLPRYRGSYSIPWAILNDEEEIGVTLHQVAPSIDDGPILDQRRFPNDRRLSCHDLYLRAVEIGVEQVSGLVTSIMAGRPPTPVPQDEARATYFPPDFPHAFTIPWKQTVTYVRDYLRACHFPPYPSASTTCRGRELVIGWPVEARIVTPCSPPGKVVVIGGAHWVTTLNGIIQPRAVIFGGQPAAFEDLASRERLEGVRLDG